jgi:hypothetical protein
MSICGALDVTKVVPSWYLFQNACENSYMACNVDAASLSRRTRPRPPVLLVVQAKNSAADAWVFVVDLGILVASTIVGLIHCRVSPIRRES